MPRQARIDAPGALEHIIIRGIEKKAIFRDDFDRNNFLQRLGTILLETSTPCFAWALLPNHAQLLLRSGLTPIATLMRRLLTAYAQYFNRRHHRYGQLFQNRYKSILCEEGPYWLELVKYIHLNPLRAGLVKDLDELGSYRYWGHAVLMEKEEHQWQVTDNLLALFGKTQEQARVHYASVVENQGDPTTKDLRFIAETSSSTRLNKFGSLPTSLVQNIDRGLIISAPWRPPLSGNIHYESTIPF